MIATTLEIPRFIKFDEGATPRFAKISVEPFERGYGTTIGNSLRRVLLSSLQGSAVTAIRVEGINHEFSAVPGVVEDLTDVVLNLKKCEICLNQAEPLIFTFKHKGEGAVTAKMLFAGQNVDVFNDDHVIFNSTSNSTKIEMEVKVARGRGYVTAEHFEFEHAPLGTIYLDANFSPVNKVNFLVEDARVGQSIDYDRLILEIWTNGSITPEKALEEASDLLIKHFRIFVKQEKIEDASPEDGGAEDPELVRMLGRPIDDLELSVRAANCLKSASIRTIGELVTRSENEMLQFHNFGKKSLDEIVQLLESMNLTLGMKVGAAFSAAGPIVDDDEEIIEEDVQS